MTTSLGARLGLAVMGGCVAAIAFYALIRVGQYIVLPEANPATIIAGTHAAFFWRAWTAAYAGGMAAFVTFVVSNRAPECVALFLVRALGVSAALLALQAAFVP